MKRKLFLFGIGIVTLCCTFAAFADSKHSKKQTNSPALNKLKSLAGEWKIQGPEGPASAEYRVISGGTSVMETMKMGDQDMVTIYYANGKDLMLTHYCSDNNQPRMKTDGSSVGDKISFAFVDATNLSAPDAGHMHTLVFQFQDADHFTQEWTYLDKEEPHVAKFEYVRVK